MMRCKVTVNVNGEDDMAKGYKIFMLAAASIATFCAASSAIASIGLPMGWYVEGNAGSSRSSSANYGTNLSNSTSGFGWNINGGYKFMPYFAAELGYTNYAKTKVTFNGAGIANATNRSYYLAAKGILPISDSGVDLFAKLGIARISNHVVISNMSAVIANGLTVNSGTHAVTAAYFGVGADYFFTPNAAVNVQWNRAKGNKTTGNLDLYSIGLSYLFG